MFTDVSGWFVVQHSGIPGEDLFDGTSQFDFVTYGLELGLIPTLPVVFQAVSGQQANHRIRSTDVPRSIGGPRE